MLYSFLRKRSFFLKPLDVITGEKYWLDGVNVFSFQKTEYKKRLNRFCLIKGLSGKKNKLWTDIIPVYRVTGKTRTFSVGFLEIAMGRYLIFLSNSDARELFSPHKDRETRAEDTAKNCRINLPLFVEYAKYSKSDNCEYIYDIGNFRVAIEKREDGLLRVYPEKVMYENYDEYTVLPYTVTRGYSPKGWSWGQPSYGSITDNFENAYRLAQEMLDNRNNLCDYFEPFDDLSRPIGE